MPSFAHHCLNFDGFFFFGSSILSRGEESSAACSLSSELALLAAFSSARDFSGTGSAIAPSLMEPVALRGFVITSKSLVTCFGAYHEQRSWEMKRPYNLEIM
jgi:hypothetical protein